MLINASNLGLVFQAFNAAFAKGTAAAKPNYPRVAMEVPSSTSEEVYGWLGDVPRIREWLGERVVKNLSTHGYAIKNKRYENTIGVARTAIEDDKFGLMSPLMTEMGKQTTEFPDELVFGLLANGFAEKCYDGRPFFDDAHPVGSRDAATSVSNFQAGSGPAWFLLDTTRTLKPLIWQPRTKFTPQRIDADNDPHVFWNDEYIYGVRGRANAGFGLWQLAFASKAKLTAENYESARATMMNLRGDAGAPLNIRPDVLVVSPGLEGAALRLLNNGTRIVVADDGTGSKTPVAVQNEWKDTASLIVTQWVA